MRKTSLLNGFLELNFKIGKLLSSLLIVITLFVIIGCGIGLMESYSQKVETPTFSMMKQRFKNVFQDTSSNTELHDERQVKLAKEDNSKYQDEIQSIITRNKLNDRIQQDIRTYLEKIPSVHQRTYLRGLNDFYHDTLTYLETEKDKADMFLWAATVGVDKYNYSKINEFERARNNIKELGKYNYYLCNGILQAYDSLFADNLKDFEGKTQENTSKQTILINAIGNALLIFVILLFLPVLIKIEENTRQYRDNKGDVHE